jgi:N-acyl-D-amino-acid deacylase
VNSQILYVDGGLLAVVTELDLVVRGATVFPGDGEPVDADVGVRDGLIAAVGSLSGAEAVEVVDGTGRCCAPGSSTCTPTRRSSHSTIPCSRRRSSGVHDRGDQPRWACAPAPVRRAALAARRVYLRASKVMAPRNGYGETFSEYLDYLDGTRPALTLVPSIGHGAVREVVLGAAPAVPSRAARRDASRGSARARGGSADAVVWARLHPGAYAGTEELVAVAREAAAFGVPLVPHVRNEGAGLLEAVGEMIDVARRSGLRFTSRT